MRVEVIQNGKVLRSVNYKAQTYVEAPPEGTYTIRLINDGPSRRLAVVSVDGINVVNGKDAGYAGPGYVLNAWQTIDIPGWRRSKKEVAAFTFQENEDSYAAQSGRGTSNLGVIGVAVFDEKVQYKVVPVIREIHHWPRHHYWGPYPGLGGTWCSTTTSTLGGDTGGGEFIGACYSAETVTGQADGKMTMTLASAYSEASAQVKGPQPRKTVRRKSVGTGYGSKTTFHTQDTTFERASDTPAEVLVCRYATLEQLKEWGVPIEEADEAPAMPNPFPMSGVSCPAPPGWNG